jgi:hypothetical protein
VLSSHRLTSLVASSQGSAASSSRRCHHGSVFPGPLLLRLLPVPADLRRPFLALHPSDVELSLVYMKLASPEVGRQASTAVRSQVDRSVERIRLQVLHQGFTVDGSGHGRRSRYGLDISIRLHWEYCIWRRSS